MTTKQQRWQDRKVADGDCANCGQSRGKYARFCDSCQAKKRAIVQRWRMRQKKKKKR